MSRLSATLRQLYPVVAVALLCTAVLGTWIRVQPLPITVTTQVALSVGAVVANAVVLALAVRLDREAEDRE